VHLEIGSIIDLGRYPIEDLDSALARNLIDQCRHDLAEHGACSLPGFVLPDAVDRTVDVGDQLAQLAWHADQSHTVYFIDPDPTVDQEHPRRRLIRSSQWAIAYDLLPGDLPIRSMYESELMLQFVAAVLGVDRLFRSVDPLDALEISLFHDGDELGWHFDNSEFSVTLMLRPSMAGGEFEFHPATRDDDDENFDAVRNAVVGSGPDATVLETAPGTLAIFKGRHALHRVTPVEGEVARMNMVLTYGAEPDMHLSELTQKLFYGRRVEPVASP
jgi:alkylated DNA repair dioxygenase AlkB